MADEDGLLSRLRASMNEGVGQWITILLVLAIIGGAIWAGIHVAGRPGTPAARKAINRGERALYVCKACKHAGEMRVPFGAQWPQECPQCGEVQAVRGFTCQGCKKITEDTGGAIVRCQHCNRAHSIERIPAAAPLPPVLK